jgi:HD-GYP domain-containing protein (c-di-GMP phosphodiesterase class II)
MSQEKANFLKIRLASIHPNLPITFNVYVHINNHFTLYMREGESLTPAKIQSLAAKAQSDFFFVQAIEWTAYKNFIQEQIKSPSIPAIEKAHILRASSMALVEELFEHPDVNVALDSSRPVIENFVAFMDSEPEAMSYLIGLSGYDFYTYNHSLDVCIYSLGLGKALGMTPKELEELGVGALFHDIGKRNVSLDILCKKGTLSKDEWTIMQQHTQFGFLILNQNNNISDSIKAACFEHHESFLGNGYPQQLQGQEIHPHARIVAITDTYDALTTQRSYNVPMMPLDALTLMKDQIHGRFDPEMLKAMHSILFQLKKTAA